MAMMAMASHGPNLSRASLDACRTRALWRRSTSAIRYITYYLAPYLPLCNLLGTFPYFTDIYPRTE